MIQRIFAKVYDIERGGFFTTLLIIEGGVVVGRSDVNVEVDCVVLPGFIDSHVHIESSMLIPSRFAELALSCGVVSVIADPHEIANVLGKEGVRFMLQDADNSPLKFYFGVPSCVPATKFETNGFSLSVKDVCELFEESNVVALSEMMNFPGVIFEDKEVMMKIQEAKKRGLPIDGHAPGLKGEWLDKYIRAGISTDHEAYSYEEAVEKIKKGMMIQIREGSAAKNFEALYNIIDEYPDNVMLCSDDIHPDDLQKGYIKNIFIKALKKGVKFENLYKVAFLNPKKHYNLKNLGSLNIGDSADFIVINDLDKLDILATYINGKKVFDKNNGSFENKKIQPINFFQAEKLQFDDIKCELKCGMLNVIKAFDGDLVTDILKYSVESGVFENCLNNDILKIVVLNRYEKNAKPSIAYINGFGFKKGAIASCIAHDSHNIISIGTNDEEILKVVNKLIDLKGGIVVSNGDEIDFLKLEIAGLMTSENPHLVAEKYTILNRMVKELGGNLNSPFMTLSFMALLVIPKLKIGDKGLFDGDNFKFIDLVE